MSILANAKAKAARGNVKEAFKNEAGAIDLASIMVGIIVIGLIGGVIAATVFAVIPWAQNNAAKQQLDSVVSAQSAFLGLSADKTADADRNKYGTKAELATAGLLATVPDLNIKATKTAGTPTYVAVVKSATGDYFKVTDAATKAAPSTAAEFTAAV
jgi:type II secretory pathway pseudopilin PulG